jgi:hypothetical protein
VNHGQENRKSTRWRRFRAERRIGELSRELEKAKAGRPGKKILPTKGKISPKGKTLAGHGIKTQSASRYEAASRMSEKDFEAAVNRERAKRKRITPCYLFRPDPRSLSCTAAPREAAPHASEPPVFLP